MKIVYALCRVHLIDNDEVWEPVSIKTNELAARRAIVDEFIPERENDTPYLNGCYKVIQYSVDDQ